MDNISRSWFRIAKWLFAALLWAAGTNAAMAFTEGVHVGTTLEGCRNDGTIVLPIGGKFVCPDAPYTTGNLGKGWNELDLVPHRLTTSLGSQTDATTDYDVYVAGDGITSGKVGWDVISIPVVNTAKSDASCSATAGNQSTLGDASTPFGGGTDTVIYRQLSIHQAKGTTCVFDYYQRLALGAHLYPGSSLQSYLATSDGLSGSKKTISIPVNEILPQSLSKDMTASQGSDHAWAVQKSATKDTLAFGDVCKADAPTSLPISITVTWTKYAAVAGGPITVITHVYATNPAARVITTSVIDKIYSGTTLLDTSPTATSDVPANTKNFLMLTHTYVAAAGTTDLNDIATATYTDNVTGVAVPGTTTATASASVQSTGPELDASAVITDVEQMTGTGLKFSVPTPSVGGFVAYPTASDPAYVAGTQTTGPVAWAANQSDSGSVTFSKTVYLNGQLVTTGTLSDSATLVGIDGFAASAGPVNVNISSTSTSTLTINKDYSGVSLATGEKLVFQFHVSSTTDPSFSADRTITMSAGGPTSGSASIIGLTPNLYVVTEGDTLFYGNGCNDSSCALIVPIQDTTGATRNVDLQTVNGVPTCSGTASYHNEPVSGTAPVAQVQKVTLPNPPTDATTVPSSWEFKLYAPDSTLLATKTAAPNAGFVDFGVALSFDGTYKVVETTPVTGWDLTTGIPNDGTITNVCVFTVNLPQDLNHVPFQCTFTNTQRGKAQVIKTENGGTPTQAFTFQLRQGATTTTTGTTLESLATSAGNGTLNFTTLLIPGGTYQMCEIVMPGWTTTLGTFVPGSFMPPDGVAPNPTVDNSILCVNFSVNPGQTYQFTIDNKQPPGGRALTIGYWKNWASCKTSGGKQAPTLDNTLYGILPNGILVGNVLSVTTAHAGQKSFFGESATATKDCAHAVNLLNKQDFSGKNKSSDPLFNMAAQLVAAELNLSAGAYTCPAVATAVNDANALLSKYNFVGSGYTGKLSASDSTKANSLAKTLDDYNNDRASVCQ